MWGVCACCRPGYWIERAATKGHEVAIEYLARLDKKKVERLYRTAADRGDAAAQTNLAHLLDDDEEAFRYFALAADQGVTDAENNLGACYHDGKGTEVDLDKARYWYARAAAKGNDDAAVGARFNLMSLESGL